MKTHISFFLFMAVIMHAMGQSTWIQSQTSWLNGSYTNTIITPQNTLDNNPNTNGYLAMSNWSTTYTKEMYMNFGLPKNIDGFKFYYIFPNTTQGACSSYPGPIYYTCKGNLYYKNTSGAWITAYNCPNLNTIDPSLVCPMEDSATFTFTGITAQEWKFEMVGNYWLGGSFQTTTYYRVKDLYFRESATLAPAIQATNIIFTNIEEGVLRFDWTDGNGSNRAVFIKQNTSGSANPVNNTSYLANTMFGMGSQIGSTGWYCVFNGTVHSGGITVTNLSPYETYRVMVCEYSGAAGQELYNVLPALNNPKNQKTCNMWSLVKTITSNRALSDAIACTDNYVFVEKASNDSMLVYDINSGNLIHKQKISMTASGGPAFTIKNSRLYYGRTMYVLRSYDISDIHNWVTLDSIAGLTKGFLRFWPDDNTMIAWGKHWASQYQMIDISSVPMVLKCNVGTGGNNYMGARVGNYVFVGNAYQQCTRIDIADPSNCVATSFGGKNSVRIFSSNLGYVIYSECYSTPVKTTIYNQSNTKTGEIIHNDPAYDYGLADNYYLISDPAANAMKVYNISDGTFNHYMKDLSANYGFFTHNTNYLIRLVGNTMEFYQRTCEIATIQASNIAFSDIQTDQMTINWTDGNDSKRAAFIKEGSDGIASPINGATYTANTTFGSGSQIDNTGWYCVFNGVSHNSGVNVRNLKQNKTYRVMVCEYNGDPGAEEYNTDQATDNPKNETTLLCIPSDGLVAWYPFNGTAGDESGTGNNGTVHGATLTTDRFGNAGKAYLFNGTSDYIEVTSSNSLKLTTGFTVNAWVCLDSFVIAPYACNAIVSKVADGDWSGGYELKAIGSEDPDYRQFQSTAKISGINATVTGYANYSTGTWYMVTAMYDGSQYRIYVNGSLADEISRTGLAQTSDIPLRIGRRGGAEAFDNWFQGKIDDIRIYNRGLEQADIDMLLLEGQHAMIVAQPVSESVCVGHPATFSLEAAGNDLSYVWQLDPGTGFSDIDDSGIYSGSRTSSLTVNDASLPMNGYSYRCIISGTCMATSISDTAALNVFIIPASAGSIEGRSIVFPVQSGVNYSVSPITGATGYNWTLPPGAVIGSGENTNSITVDFSSSASSGEITVTGTNICGSGIASPAFTITVRPAIPSLISVINQIVANGQSACFNAKQTITVAGNGNIFFVLDGGSAEFIAGQNILFLPGTNVLSGGYLHGSITNTWDYCGANGKTIVQNEAFPGKDPEIRPAQENFFKIYPNPTTGQFTIKMTGENASSDAICIIYSMMGEKVMQQRLSEDSKTEISLDGQPAGIYIIRVISGSEAGTAKISKL